MTGLERRLSKLEAVSLLSARVPVLFVSFQGPGEPDVPATATVDGRVWHRGPDESPDAFQSRVTVEARPTRRGCGVLVVLE
jgi:hypothetical protein